MTVRTACPSIVLSIIAHLPEVILKRSGVEGSPVAIKSPLKGIGYWEREIPPLRSG
ncbi:hypothetical protein [Ravibacter arvi]|uniref:hypothetical protein n=1 Tax=Ravibacter arvi TaxID=2051041 RepID=UPI0031E6974B